MIRKATLADKDFLITAIIEAEKSGSDQISYCSIFSISETQLREMLSNILDEDVQGQELCISDFLVAEEAGEPVAACCAWIENETGMASSLIKGNLLTYFMDSETLLNAAPLLRLMNEINIHREPGTLQIEAVYTRSDMRGKGLGTDLINEHIACSQATGKKFSKVQVQLLGNNKNAVKAYEKAKFILVEEKTAVNPDIFKLLPYGTKLLMERKLNY